MTRRMKLTTGQVVVMAIAALGFLGFVAWLVGGSYLRQRNFAMSRAAEATVMGPPCPQLTAAAFAARGLKASKATNYEGVIFARMVGHMDCNALRYGSGWGTDTYPVCQFTGPVGLHIKTGEGEWFFEPGPGQPATVAVPRGKATCVMDSNFTFSRALAR